MKGSLIIISFFILGVGLSYLDLLPQVMYNDGYTMYILYLLLFCVGVSIGCDTTIISSLKKYGYLMFILPLATIIGTIIGSAAISVLIKDYTMAECVAVGCGFGYYSLSSIFLTEMKGPELGTVALLSNVTREMITLVFAPLLVLVFGKLAPISAGGATTMDTTLPIITRYSGKEFVVIAIFHGFMVDLTVPFLVTFFASF